MARKTLGLGILFVLLSSNVTPTIATTTTGFGNTTASGTTVFTPTSSGGSSGSSSTQSQVTPTPVPSPTSSHADTSTKSHIKFTQSNPLIHRRSHGHTDILDRFPDVNSEPTHDKHNLDISLPLGCYNEGSNGRALPDFFVEDDVLMTIDKCAHLCSNYTFLGLEYGSQCWCSNSIQNGAFPIDDGQCSTVCAGDASQFCGGEDTLSVFLPPPPPPPRPANNITFTAAGCYAEPADGSRALGQARTAADDMTPASCFNICGTSGWVYAGLEYGQECWCGSHLSKAATKVDPGQCNLNCSGDATQTCGGDHLLNLYNGTYSHSAVAGQPPLHAAFWDRLLNGDV
ncbi:hypothetical protein Daus18300_010268 [Diaporthe australafricana]|uniref:WSC domain-containing protein n=1 Tax=Diaporthe australafricana TaxID=127596 RepID=A0ABR3WB16_9PEZI